MKKQTFIIKNAVCILVCIIVLLSQSALADLHMEIQGTFSDSDEIRIISADIYDQKEKITAVSSLFPEMAVVLDRKETDPFRMIRNVFDFSSPEQIDHTIGYTKKIISEWMEQLPHEDYSGVYSGDAFEYASKLRTYEFSVSAFKEYINKKNTDLPKGQSDSDDYNGVVIQWMDMFLENDFMQDSAIRINSYDEGVYYTVSVLKDNKIMLTISGKRAVEQEMQTVIGYRNGGRYYFREVNCICSKDYFSMDSALFSGKESSYRTYAEKKPLFHESLILKQENNHSVSFKSTIETKNVSAPLHISGEINLYDENNAESWETQMRPVTFADKKTANISDLSAKDEIQNAAYSGIVSLITEIIPRLPYDYQNLIVNLFLK